MLCQSTVLEICDVSPVDAETCDVTDSEGFVWLLHSRVVSLFSLDEGVSVPLADLMLAAVASSLLAARILLRRVLGRTRKPARRCRELLAAHGIGLTDADCAVLLAEVTGVLDDRTWARDLAEIRFERRKDGPLAIRQWLGQRGFDPETVRQAIAGLGELADPVETACDLLEKRFSRSETSHSVHQKAWALLARRGYPAETTRKALRRFFGGIEEYD